jgi:tRNA (guanine37-N1)-methyltransferase
MSVASSITILTVFPELFGPFFEKGLIGQAVKKGHLKFDLVNPRDFATDRHRSVDDRPYGGGDGMVMLPEVMSNALSSVQKADRPVILLSPQGARLNVPMAKELATLPGMILICARYGGVDERFVTEYVDREISIGDYVLCGGEIPAMAVIEAVARFQPGFLGHEQSAEQDSFSDGLLEAPLFTRPAEFRGAKVPEILLGGHHRQIKDWRSKVGLLRTSFRRPDLLGPSHAGRLAEALAWFRTLSGDEREALGLPRSDS